MAHGWEAPDGSRSVVFARGVVSALRARALEAFLAVPKRGAEIGGLLLGRVLRADPLLARITGFEEIPCQYRYGPSYVLAEEERARLEAALQRERSDPAIGFVRSYTGREMLLDEADRNLLSRYFPDARSIFLLLQPRAHAPFLAAFLFPENDEVGWEPRYPPFEFDEARLGALAPDEPAVALAETPPALDASVAAAETLRSSPADESGPGAAAPLFATVPRFARARQQTDAEPRPKKHRFVIPLIAWIALSIAAAGVYELWGLARAPRWTPLGLNAQMAAGAIHLGWDRGSRPARQAERGVLTIDDGGARKRIALEPEQIRGGGYDYRPAAADVLFRMELSGPGIQAAGDSLRVITAPAVAAEPPQSPPRPPEAVADREAGGPHSAGVAVLPEPLREIHPDVPAGIRARIHDRMVVPVEVKVTATGRVFSAQPHGSGDSLYKYLADRAAQAARQWRFSPARSRNGKPVPASRTVYFVFTRTEGG